MNKGQSLIEVLVGLSSAVLVVGAITVATITALNNAVYSKNENHCKKLYESEAFLKG